MDPQLAGHVVVVQMRLQHVRRPQVALGKQALDPVNVSLGVDDRGDIAMRLTSILVVDLMSQYTPKGIYVHPVDRPGQYPDG